MVAVEAASGKPLWNRPQPDVLPLTLTADAERVLFHNGEKIVCLDRRTGEPRWSSEPLNRRKEIPTFFAPTLVIYRDVVLFSGGDSKPGEQKRGGGTDTMYGLAADTGKTIWTAEHPPSGYKSP